MTTAYYNENAKSAALWLGDLQRAGLISPGQIDERSITNVQKPDLDGATRVHFFAGIGGWDYALQLAGWPDDIPVWTGSCPCQPFSGAGKMRGDKDSRHLWPEFHRLIRECLPKFIFGEQVAGPLGREWLDGISLDLEELGYAVGAADLCAASVGAPHIRQRLFWVAHLGITGCEAGRATTSARSHSRTIDAGRVGYTDQSEPRGNGRAAPRTKAEGRSTGGKNRCVSDNAGPASATGEPWGDVGGLPNTDDPKRRPDSAVGHNVDGAQAGRHQSASHNGACSPWDDYRIVQCSDEKARRIESTTEPLVDGFPGRMDQLRGLGNAIVPQVAAEFVKAFMCIYRM